MTLSKGIVAIGLSVIGHLVWLTTQPVIVAPQRAGVAGHKSLAIALVKMPIQAQTQVLEKVLEKVQSQPRIEKPKPVKPAELKAVELKPVKQKSKSVIAATQHKPPPKVDEQPAASNPVALPKTLPETLPKTAEVVSEAKFRMPPQSPVYPRLALRRRQQGEAWVKALVNAEGETQNVVLSRSSGFDSLDRSALAAVSKWLFAAAQVNGRPVTAWVEVPVSFVIH
jgi:protein TonB